MEKDGSDKAKQPIVKRDSVNFKLKYYTALISIFLSEKEARNFIHYQRQKTKLFFSPQEDQFLAKED